MVHSDLLTENQSMAKGSEHGKIQWYALTLNLTTKYISEDSWVIYKKLLLFNLCLNTNTPALTPSPRTPHFSESYC